MKSELGSRLASLFNLFKESKFSLREQPGLSKKAIADGYVKFKEAQAEKDPVKRMQLLKKAAEEHKSFHAASLYCKEFLRSLEIKDSEFLTKFQKMTKWYLETARIHGSPTFLHLAVIYYDFANGSARQQFYEQAYIYVKLGQEWASFSTDMSYNAYLGHDFSSTNKVFATPLALETACIIALKKFITDFKESAYKSSIEEHGSQFRELVSLETKNNREWNFDL